MCLASLKSRWFSSLAGFVYHRLKAGTESDSVSGQFIQHDHQMSQKMPSVASRFSVAVARLVLPVVLAGATDTAMAGVGLVAQTTAPVSNVVSGRSFTVEIGIVVIMFGGALFAVCRSSNRT